MRYAAAFFFSMSLAAYGETPLFRADFGDTPHYLQKISDDEIVYCPISTIGYAHCEYHRAELNDEGHESFGSRPNLYLFSGDSFRITNIITDFVRMADTVQIIDVPISAATYVGNWGGQAATSVSIRTMDKNGKGTLSYSFKGKKSTPSFRQIGNVSVAKMGGGASLYILQNGETAYGLFLTSDGDASHATLEAQPFEFANSAVCVQAYLNYLGFPVGKADGAIGPGSRAGGEAYLKANPSVELEPLSKKNTDEWCDYFNGLSDVEQSVVAVSGM